MPAVARERFDNLPLFASDTQIGAALLGKNRAGEWPTIAPLLERRGLPVINKVMGGRYTPAVKAFFDRQYGLTHALPEATDHEEEKSWNSTRRSRRA